MSGAVQEEHQMGHAIVVGINSYQYRKQLYRAAYDACAVAKHLRQIHFGEIQLLVDQDVASRQSSEDEVEEPYRNNFIERIRDVGKKLKDDDVLLLFFSGHCEILPRTKDPALFFADSTPSDDKTIIAEKLAEILDQYGNLYTVIILDTCAPGKEFAEKLLLKLNRPGRTLIIFWETRLDVFSKPFWMMWPHSRLTPFCRLLIQALSAGEDDGCISTESVLQELKDLTGEHFGGRLPSVFGEGHVALGHVIHPVTGSSIVEYLKRHAGILLLVLSVAVLVLGVLLFATRKELEQVTQQNKRLTAKKADVKGVNPDDPNYDEFDFLLRAGILEGYGYADSDQPQLFRPEGDQEPIQKKELPRPFLASLDYLQKQGKEKRVRLGKGKRWHSEIYTDIRPGHTCWIELRKLVEAGFLVPNRDKQKFDPDATITVGEYVDEWLFALLYGLLGPASESGMERQESLIRQVNHLSMPSKRILVRQGQTELRVDDILGRRDFLVSLARALKLLAEE
jgi:caspase domain-containing protein